MGRSSSLEKVFPSQKMRALWAYDERYSPGRWRILLRTVLSGGLAESLLGGILKVHSDESNDEISIGGSIGVRVMAILEDCKQSVAGTKLGSEVLRRMTYQSSPRCETERKVTPPA